MITKARFNTWFGNWKAVNFAILAGLNYLDYWTTKILLENGGSEANPIMDYVIVHNGIDSIFLVKIFALGVVLIAIKYMNVRLLILLNVFYTIIVLNNSYLVWTI